jgi:N-acetyl-anhydromuramyl-L-alanine amidase AmpD
MPFNIPAEWMPAARMQRVILHWTAGRHVAQSLDRQHNHLLVENDGNVVRGIPSIAANGVGSSLRPRAAHTLNCNTGSIGVSMCAMGFAEEFPFDAGRWPLTKEQWLMAARVVGQLCDRYRIPVMRETVLSHAEVQGTLGIKQRGKWDVTRLPWDAKVVGARACGDAFRSTVLEFMAMSKIVSPPSPLIKPGPATDGSRPILREGASGLFVTQMQTALTGQGFPVAADGRWGPITTRAIKAFQRARSLPTDGVVGPATWAALLA